MKYTIIIVLLFANFSFASSQEFTKYNIESIGLIEIPELMEIRTGHYKDIIDKIICYGLENEKIVFQQKGLNKLDNFETYARLIVKSYDCYSYDDCKSSDSEIVIDINELAKTNKEYEEEINSMLNSYNPYDMKIILWEGYTIEKINNQYAEVIRYIRRNGNNPKAYVQIFTFHNKTKKYEITVSYWLRDKEIWEAALNHAINSFTIETKH